MCFIVWKMVFYILDMMFPYKYVLPRFSYRAWFYKLFSFYIKNWEHMAYNYCCYIKRCVFKGYV